MLGFSPYGTSTPGEVRGPVRGTASGTLNAPSSYGAAFVTIPVSSQPITAPDLGDRSVPVQITGQAIPYWPDARSPSDVSLYGMDFEGLPPAESISSVVSVLASPSDLVVGNPTLYGLEVQFLISGGSSGVEYNVTATIRTTTGETFERSAVLYTVSR